MKNRTLFLSHPSKAVSRKLIALLAFLFALTAMQANTYTVSNLNEEGEGSLRQALLDANANPGADLIDFSVAGVLTLPYWTLLPEITDALTIDGTTAPGYMPGTPSFILDGDSGYLFNANEPGALTIRGLQMNDREIPDGACINVYATFGTVEVRDCKMLNWNTAVRCSGNADWTIANNDLRSSSQALHFNGVGSGSITAYNNLFGGPDASGIYLENCSNKVIGDENTLPAADILIRDSDGMSDVKQYAFRTVDCSDLTFDNLNLNFTGGSQGNRGLTLQNSSGTMIVRNCNLQNRGLALFCGGEADWTVTGNDLRYSAYPLTFAYNSGTISASGNLFGGGSNIQYALRLVGVSNLVIGDENAVPAADILIKDTDGMVNLLGSALEVTDCSNLTFDNLDLSNPPFFLNGSGINAQNCSGSMAIKNCRIQYRDGAVGCDGDADWTIRDNDFRNTGTAMGFSFVHTGTIAASGNLVGSPQLGPAVYMYNCSGKTIGSQNAVPAADIVIKDSEGLRSRPNIAIDIWLSSDMTLDGLDLSNATGGVSGTGVEFAGTLGTVTVRNCTVNDRSAGIWCSGTTMNSAFSCNILHHCGLGLVLDGTHTDNLVINNVFESNDLSAMQGGSTVMMARNNYWGGGAPANNAYNGYSGLVDAANPLTAPAACTPFTCPDSDHDGICDNEDNCTTGPDADCDGISDICDVCPTGVDAVDNNHDGIADCSQLLAYNQYSPAWYCGANKIQVCHNGNTQCISKNALASHFAHGDKIGPCSGCNAQHREDLSDAVAGESLGLTLSPNPATDLVQISLDGVKTPGELRITNRLGATVWTMPLQEGQTEIAVDLAEQRFASGVYFVSVRWESGWLSERLVVVR